MLNLDKQGFMGGAKKKKALRESTGLNPNDKHTTDTTTCTNVIVSVTTAVFLVACFTLYCTVL